MSRDMNSDEQREDRAMRLELAATERQLAAASSMRERSELAAHAATIRRSIRRAEQARS